MGVKVYELMQRLSLNQLGNLAMGVEGTGSIRESDQPKIIAGINSAMQRLVSRFLIETKNIKVFLLPDQVVYPLKPEHTYSYYAANPGTPGHPFIYDMDQGIYTEFKGDILQLIAVQDGWNRSVSFNDPMNRLSVSFPSPDKLVIKADALRHNWFNGTLDITYKPKYTPLPLTSAALEMDVPVPEVLEDAMLYLIASMIYGGMNGQENAAIAQGHLNTFEAMCNEVSLTDVINESTSSIGERFDKNGFV